MNVAVIIVTKNRLALFQQTIATLLQAEGDYGIVVVDAGSRELNREWTRDQMRVEPRLLGLLDDTGPLLTTSMLKGVAFHRGFCDPDAWLMTGDDYVYRPDWYAGLTTWLGHLSGDPAVSHVCLDIEPAFAWARVTGTCESGGVRALIRDTIPCANWAMTRDQWATMAPFYETHLQERTFDHLLNAWARSEGRVCCALDLAVHAGACVSTTGGGSYTHARPLDVRPYGLRPRTDPVSPWVEYGVPA